jgi:uncharacterized protein (DUF1800 family)
MTVHDDIDRACPVDSTATGDDDRNPPATSGRDAATDADTAVAIDRRAAFAALASFAVVGLSACSSEDSGEWTTAEKRATPGTGRRARPDAVGPRVSRPVAAAAVPVKPATQAEAVRFLNQATCGATQADIDRLMQIGYGPWLDEQFAMPMQHGHVQHVKRVAAQRPPQNWGNRPTIWDVNDSMWLGMMKNDQLRQRIMFALSQIFVVSLRDGSTYYLGSGLAAYVDMLYAKGFGNWRDLIEGVALSTAMGSYLSHIYNREDLANGVRPDQNFAREVMQLFTIGLWQLNADGSRKLDGNGKPIPTYSGADVAGAARVMTGWTFDAATDLHWERYYGFWEAADMPVQERPMKAFPAYHSRSEKKFLGVTIPASTVSDPVGELKILLDTLFNHPNTAPFFCRQMIQRLVTSNPSPAYIARVVAVFGNNGSNVRGDLKAVIKAILLDPEARDNTSVSLPTFGRVREQILRMTQVMRVFKATPDADPDSYGIGLWMYDRSKALWQTPLGSPTVFNFYFPGYTPPNSTLSAQSLVAPEMQIVTQSSSADTWWFFKDLLQNGGLTDCCSDALRNTYYLKLDYSQWLPLVANPASVADRLSTLFMAGQMSAQLKDAIVAGMNARYQENSETSGMIRGRDQIKLAEAISFMLMSPEYVVQK